MSTGQSILGTRLLDLLYPSSANKTEVATFGNEGSNATIRFYDQNNINTTGYLMGISNATFILQKQTGATSVGIGTNRKRTTAALEINGAMATSNITTFNSDSNIWFSSKNIVGINSINFAGSLLQNGEPFKTSQWTTSSSNIYLVDNSNVGIGTTTPQYPLHVQGDAYFSGTVYAYDLQDMTNQSINYKYATVYNGAQDGTKTIQTNATTASSRIVFSTHLMPGRYIVTASIPFYNLSSSTPIDNINWASMGLYKASPATFTNTTAPIYTAPMSSIGSTSTDLESVPFSMTLIVDDHNGADFVLAVSGRGHLLKFGNAANVPELKFFAIPLRGIGQEDAITTRRAIQMNAVRGYFTATSGQTIFNLPNLEGNFTSAASNTDVFVNGSKLNYETAYSLTTNYNATSNLTAFTITTTTGVTVGAKVDIAVWPTAAIASDYYQSGYLYQNVLNVTTPWLNLVGGGIRAPDRVVVDGDLFVKGNIYGGCNTVTFSAGTQWDSVSAISSNIIGTENIIDGAITPSKLNLLSGNVGIGTADPQALLHVQGNVMLSSGSAITSASSATILGGTIQNYWVERNGNLSLNNRLAWGNGSSTSPGIKMPFAGRVIYATASSLIATGSATIQILKNETITSTESITIDSTTPNPVLDLRNAPYTFDANDIICWVVTDYTAQVSTVVLAFWVIFD